MECSKITASKVNQERILYKGRSKSTEGISAWIYTEDEKIPPSISTGINYSIFQSVLYIKYFYLFSSPINLQLPQLWLSICIKYSRQIWLLVPLFTIIYGLHWFDYFAEVFVKASLIYFPFINLTYLSSNLNFRIPNSLILKFLYLIVCTLGILVIRNPSFLSKGIWTQFIFPSNNLWNAGDTLIFRKYFFWTLWIFYLKVHFKYQYRFYQI